MVAICGDTLYTSIGFGKKGEVRDAVAKARIALVEGDGDIAGNNWFKGTKLDVSLNGVVVAVQTCIRDFIMVCIVEANVETHEVRRASTGVVQSKLRPDNA